MQALLKSTLSPFEEQCCYETIWAVPGITESRVSALFENGDLPSLVVSNLTKSERYHFDLLLPKIKNYLQLLQTRYSVCVSNSFQYPARLRDARHPVDLFYYQGNLSILDQRLVAIVGARSASEEGKARARKLGRELAASNYTVVSGLAIGIDTAALNGALEISGAHVVGVIGTPINQYYPNPQENDHLQERIAKRHLLISQVPFFRYEHESFNSRRFYFPRRNSTMSALTLATIIVEASEKSGTLTQARAALYQGRNLFILNSCFESPKISWPEQFEKKGAIRVYNTNDILVHLEKHGTVAKNRG